VALQGRIDGVEPRSRHARIAVEESAEERSERALREHLDLVPADHREPSGLQRVAEQAREGGLARAGTRARPEPGRPSKGNVEIGHIQHPRHRSADAGPPPGPSTSLVGARGP
jgi:hypothetical protein